MADLIFNLLVALALAVGVFVGIRFGFERDEEGRRVPRPGSQAVVTLWTMIFAGFYAYDSVATAVDTGAVLDGLFLGLAAGVVSGAAMLVFEHRRKWIGIAVTVLLLFAAALAYYLASPEAGEAYFWGAGGMAMAIWFVDSLRRVVDGRRPAE